MSRAVGFFAIVVLLLGFTGAGLLLPAPSARADAQETAFPLTVPPPLPSAPRPQLPPPVQDVVQSGVLIVVSKASQRMHVFKDGAHWGSSPVSTGKRGHSTPAGVFPILQKRVHHRSNIYSNAPMPFMQRLTWRGIAIHAGYLPGYPASHGCIRLPRSFAKALFGLTQASRTTVVVTNAPLHSEEGAITLALNAQGPASPGPQTAPTALASVVPTPPALPVSPPVSETGPPQTIQLAAALSPSEAEAHWLDAVARHPELSGFRKVVVPATIGARKYWRLRASAPGAYAVCSSLKRSGTDCFNVI